MQSAMASLPDLTPREREILAELPGGATYRAIARRLGLSPHTVDTYLRRVRSKTGLTNRTQLVVLALSIAPAAAGDLGAHEESARAA